MGSPGERLAESMIGFAGRAKRFPAFLRRHLLLIIFGAILAMQIMIWLELDLIFRAIPYGAYEGPSCGPDRPCHVIIEKSRYP